MKRGSWYMLAYRGNEVSSIYAMGGKCCEGDRACGMNERASICVDAGVTRCKLGRGMRG